MPRRLRPIHCWAQCSDFLSNKEGNVKGVCSDFFSFYEALVEKWSTRAPKMASCINCENWRSVFMRSRAWNRQRGGKKNIDWSIDRSIVVSLRGPRLTEKLDGVATLHKNGLSSPRQTAQEHTPSCIFVNYFECKESSAWPITMINIFSEALEGCWNIVLNSLTCYHSFQSGQKVVIQDCSRPYSVYGHDEGQIQEWEEKKNIICSLKVDLGFIQYLQTPDLDEGSPITPLNLTISALYRN